MLKTGLAFVKETVDQHHGKKPPVTAADILWEKYPDGCAISMRVNGRVIVHPDMLREAQREADERNKS